MIKTGTREAFNGGHQAWFKIDNQTFYLQEVESEEGMTSKEKAEWYEKNLNAAFEKLAQKSPLKPQEGERDYCKCKPTERIISPPNPRRMEDGKIRKCGRCLKPLSDKFQYGNSIAEEYAKSQLKPQQCEHNIKPVKGWLHKCTKCPYTEFEATVNSQLKPQEGEWISVKDKLPEDAEQFLVNVKDTEPRIEMCLYLYDGDWGHNMEITHWQPLPKPPTH